jgi:hypothetical protein
MDSTDIRGTFGYDSDGSKGKGKGKGKGKVFACQQHRGMQEEQRYSTTHS